jgi:hypothetical protein
VLQRAYLVYDETRRETEGFYYEKERKADEEANKIIDDFIQSKIPSYKMPKEES